VLRRPARHRITGTQGRAVQSDSYEDVAKSGDFTKKYQEGTFGRRGRHRYTYEEKTLTRYLNRLPTPTS